MRNHLWGLAALQTKESWSQFFRVEHRNLILIASIVSGLIATLANYSKWTAKLPNIAPAKTTRVNFAISKSNLKKSYLSAIATH
jgi:hypothetical protein